MKPCSACECLVGSFYVCKSPSCGNWVEPKQPAPDLTHQVEFGYMYQCLSVLCEYEGVHTKQEVANGKRCPVCWTGILKFMGGLWEQKS